MNYEMKLLILNSNKYGQVSACRKSWLTWRRQLTEPFVLLCSTEDGGLIFAISTVTNAEAICVYSLHLGNSICGYNYEARLNVS